MSLADLRQHYDPDPLTTKDLADDPFDQFLGWFEQARAADILEPNAFTLATAGPDGEPDARVVLLKGVDDPPTHAPARPDDPHRATPEPTSAELYRTPGDETPHPAPPRGLVFFSNYASAKAQQLAANPRCVMNFYWDRLTRCVRIAGRVQKVDPQETAEYFHSRPYASQLGAWASPQSETIADREVLRQRFEQLQRQYPEPAEGQPSPVPAPEFWGGYRVVPESFEFWQGQPSRLHDRLKYLPHAEAPSGWRVVRLAP